MHAGSQAAGSGAVWLLAAVLSSRGWCRPQTAGQAEQEPSQRARSQPIDVDPRREHNKVRMQLTGTGTKSSTSPYGTPKTLSRSPLSSPLVGNASQVPACTLGVLLLILCLDFSGDVARGVCLCVCACVRACLHACRRA